MILISRDMCVIQRMPASEKNHDQNLMYYHLKKKKFTSHPHLCSTLNSFTSDLFLSHVVKDYNCVNAMLSVCIALLLICPLTGTQSSDTCFIFPLFSFNHSFLLSLAVSSLSPPPLFTLSIYFFLSRKESVSP